MIHLDNGELFVVKRGTSAVIGRDPHLEVSLPHPRISRQHAEVVYSGAQWILRDLDSANGIFVDGLRVTEVILDSTLAIRLGGTSGPELTISATPEIGDTAEPKQGRQTRVDHLPLPPRLRIGRHSTNDVVVPGEGVADFQASISENARGFHEVVDTNNHSMTTVNAIAVVKRKRLEPGDVLSVGDWSMRYTGNALEKLEATGGFSFVADGLKVVAGEKTLLDDITFQLRPRTLTAVIGPSGSGKSTLLGALTGRRQADYGNVYVGDLDLYKQYDYLRNRIGLVPQSDLLHTNLTTQKALEYAAALRFPRHVPEEEQLERVDEVIRLLGLEQRRHLHSVSNGAIQPRTAHDPPLPGHFRSVSHLGLGQRRPLPFRSPSMCGDALSWLSRAQQFESSCHSARTRFRRYHAQPSDKRSKGKSGAFSRIASLSGTGSICLLLLLDCSQ